MQYLSRYKLMILLALVLAAINQGFSLLNPIVSGMILDRFVNHPFTVDKEGLIVRDLSTYLSQALVLIGAIMGFAMISRIAKNFQDYTVNVVIQKYGARLYTDGLRHALRLPYQDFEDQSSGQTLSVLQKVRTDCEKFINSFFNVLLPTIIGIVFVVVFSLRISTSRLALDCHLCTCYRSRLAIEDGTLQRRGEEFLIESKHQDHNRDDDTHNHDAEHHKPE